MSWGLNSEKEFRYTDLLLIAIHPIVEKTSSCFGHCYPSFQRISAVTVWPGMGCPSTAMLRVSARESIDLPYNPE